MFVNVSRKGTVYCTVWCELVLFHFLNFPFSLFTWVVALTSAWLSLNYFLNMLGRRGGKRRKKWKRWIRVEVSPQKGKSDLVRKERESYFSLMVKEWEFIRKALTDVLIRLSSWCMVKKEREWGSNIEGGREKNKKGEGRWGRWEGWRNEEKRKTECREWQREGRKNGEGVTVKLRGGEIFDF